ncbi:hypothetical protein B0T16DRAFT_456561 [Cercophora newfieldiana]|uniref:Uncharacterized protein n=1 Tax=Cercophora newfieldiana TaxID=92897 RepID=A0AA39YB91_9PEZI|nr:hypothetical protein B0T16DRAFT_456561 [Cercophora newfieldiana]
MAPLWGRVFWSLYLGVETKIVESILRIPAFHHGVGKIHKMVQDLRHGRDPNEPMRQGEATEDPEKLKPESFLRHFVDELRNQARGTPTDDDPPSSRPGPPKR